MILSREGIYFCLFKGFQAEFTSLEMNSIGAIAEPVANVKYR